MAQTSGDIKARIDGMFMRDKIWAWGFVVALWLTVIMVLFEINAEIPSNGIRVACWLAALILVIFNTASIAAMVNHYGHDKEHIYGTDIRHLDAGR